MKTKHADPWAQAIVFQGLTGIFSLIITLFFGFRSPPSFLILNFLLMIILLTLASVFTFQAFQLIEASEVGILMSSQRLWTTIAAFIFLKETPTFSKIL